MLVVVGSVTTAGPTNPTSKPTNPGADGLSNSDVFTTGSNTDGPTNTADPGNPGAFSTAASCVKPSLLLLLVLFSALNLFMHCDKLLSSHGPIFPVNSFYFF